MTARGRQRQKLVDLVGFFFFFFAFPNLFAEGVQDGICRVVSEVMRNYLIKNLVFKNKQTNKQKTPWFFPDYSQTKASSDKNVLNK